MLSELKCFSHEVVFVNELVSLLTDANGTRHAIRLHLVGNQHILSEDVVSDHLRTDDATYDLACVDADTHVQIAQGRILGLVALFNDDVDHLKADLDNSECLLDLDNR